MKKLLFCPRRFLGMRLALLLPLVAGCAIRTTPLDRAQLDRRVAWDIRAIFDDMVFPKESLTLEQAMSRAVNHNLQQRVVALEGALALGLSDLAVHSLLPQVQASGDYVQRDRTTSLTQDFFQTSASLEATWSVLDFGVSYINARQKSDGVLISGQQRRKAALDLIFEVETAFGQALVAQRLEASLGSLLLRVEKALENAREVERQGIQPARESLDFQKKLLKILDQLQKLQRQVSGARFRLAELLNLSSGALPPLQDPGFVLPLDIRALPGTAELEEYALINRPELLERHYQRRVQADESRKALLRLLPGVELSSGHRYDSGGIYVNHHWAENGVNLAWNLLKVVTGPDILDQARVEEALEERKRLALTMTVMTQVRVAHLGLMESRIGYETALELSKVDRRLFDHAQAGRDVATMSEAQLIEAEADLLLQDARRDLASAELSSAAARLLVSVGFDRLPFGFDTMDTQQLTWALEEIARRPAWATYTPLRPQGEQAGGGVKESKFQGEDSGKSSQRKDARMADPVWTLEKPGPTDPTGVLPKKSPADPGLKSRENSRNGFDGGAGMEGGVVLRVGAFSALENARNLYSRLAEKKYPVTLQPFADSGGRVLYHVSVGPVQGVRRGRKLLADLSDREGIKAQPVFLAPFVAESHGRGRVSMAALHGVDQVLVAKMKGP